MDKVAVALVLVRVRALPLTVDLILQSEFAIRGNSQDCEASGMIVRLVKELPVFIEREMTAIALPKGEVVY